ncbi:MAG: GNAT family N-acetyltransferase [Candidatus Latescibacterota bacterium]|nr:MAG: GNAT family N-acetyltransferase [Candidatus Latescibacterota bacterium]
MTGAKKHDKAIIVRADSAERTRQAKTLFEEYARSLTFGLEFQDFDEEMRNFPGDYSPPSGSLLLALIDDLAVGCVALRSLSDDTCEMKRLYVKPRFRGLRLGRRLAKAIIDEARRIGYARMRLDAIRSMKAAVELYTTLGFKEIPPYRHNPIEGAVFLELVLV